MDQRVESFENEVGSLTAGQQQIMAQLAKIVSKLNSQTIIPPANMEREDRENSVAPLQTHGGRPGNNLGTRQTRTPNSYAPKFVKLDLPRFNGEGDTASWICRVEQYFQFHQTPEEDQVPLASFHLEGDAQLWYQLLKQEEDVMTWKEFTDG